MNPEPENPNSHGEDQQANQSASQPGEPVGPTDGGDGQSEHNWISGIINGILPKVLDGSNPTGSSADAAPVGE